MIREGKAVRYEEYCYMGDGAPEDLLAQIEQRIGSVAASSGVPVELSRDQMLSGGVLSKKADGCVCIEHPVKRSSYFRFCIRVSQAGGRSRIETFQYGTSKSHKMIVSRMLV